MERLGLIGVAAKAPLARADQHVEDKGRLGAILSGLSEVPAKRGQPSRKGLSPSRPFESRAVKGLYALGQIGASLLVICRPVVHPRSPSGREIKCVRSQCAIVLAWP